MDLKKPMGKLNKAIYKYISANFSRVIFSFIILLDGISYMSVSGSAIFVLSSVIFTAALLAANHWKGRNLYRYIFATIAIMSFYIPVQAYHLELMYVDRVIFYIPLIYSYLLPDIVSPNVLGMMLALLLSGYFGEVDIHDLVGVIVGVLYVSIAFSIVFYLLRRLNTEKDKYHKISTTDSLTGLATLKHFMEKCQDYLDKYPESAMLFIDLDRFKQINDTYGHITGNKILIEFSNLLRNELADTDCIVGRLGGDEFVVFLYDLPHYEVKMVMERLYHCTKNKVFYINPNLPPIKVSLTIGEAHSNRYKMLSIQELLNQADSNMYINKFGEYKLSHNKFLDNVKLPDKCKQLLKILEEKDAYTYIHSQYVARYASELAAALGLTEKKVRDIYVSGLIHDIGKLYIPNEILRKPAKLTKEEYMVIKDHVTDGLDILRDIQLSEVMLNGIRYHHEKFDGTGYPNGIKGYDTPIEGRIIQIADAFSAMTIKRVYRESFSLEDAIVELRKNSGSQFDPELVEIFIGLFSKKASVI